MDPNEKIKSILSAYTTEPQILYLPSAPDKPIILVDEDDRPQPRLDLNSEKGMAAVIGRISTHSFFDIRFVGLSNNTVRGAAGGAILTAELLVNKGYIHAD